MTREEKQAYARGYNASRSRSWPLHKPPLPPVELLADFVAAARELREAADTLCATLDDDDDLVKMIAPQIDALDESQKRWGLWLLEFTSLASPAIDKAKDPLASRDQQKENP